MCPKVEDEMKFQALSVVCMLTIMCLVSYAAAFSHGATPSACTDMRPKHIRAHLQNPQNNYITIHTNISFFPGDKVPVTVRSTRDFMGFMLQARRVSNDQIAGTFVYIPPGSKLLTCFEDGDTVTHSDKSLKRNLSFVWKAPDQPIGDIRFFLSVVQSYFVYWARIESSTVFQQTPNRTTENPVSSSIIRPTPLQKPTGLKEAFSASKESSFPNTILTEFAKFAPTSLTWIASTLALDPVSSVQQISEPPGSGKVLYESLTAIDISQISSHSEQTQANESGTEEELVLESSLQDQGLSFIAGSYSSNHNTYSRRQNASSLPLSVMCLTCENAVEGVSPTLNPSTSKSAAPTTASPLVHLWDPSLPLSMETMPEHSAPEENTDVDQSLSTASEQGVEKSPMTPEVPGNFLPQAELTTYGREERIKKHFSANTLKKVTKAMPKAAVSEGGGKGPQFVTAQLGVLLGCSAVLGMVLAIGLRCIHSQYCHKRTEVTFSEPENNVVALQESGEMMHFRKIRENSFVLVQAEYNWVSPSSSGKKAVI